MMAPDLQNTKGWYATELLQDIVTGDGPLAGLQVTGLSMDSRDTQQGDLFFACAGCRQHGMEFIHQAVAAGAELILAEPTAYWNVQEIHKKAQELAVPVVSVVNLSSHISAIAARYYADPALRMRMIGITGTNGKTSVSHYIAQALPESWRCAVVGTIGNGFPGELQSATHTTPDPIAAQVLLAELQQAGAESVAMEVSSHALHQHRLATVPFHTAVFTNLSRDHLDYHQSMEAYAEAKSSLFRQPGLALAVVNTDDELGQQLAVELQGVCRLIVCGRGQDTSAKSDEYIKLLDSKAGSRGLHVQFESSWGTGQVCSPLVGSFNADNLMLVLGVLLGWNVPLTESIARLEGLQPVAGRMQCMGGQGQPLVVVDYAHTPDALKESLLAARMHVAGKLVCVFGCGGDRDKGKRPLMGAVAEQLADEVIVTDDNPRHESSESIITQIIEGMGTRRAVRVIPSRSQAISAAIQQAAQGDVVLVAGKGHENYQQIGDLRHPFSDVSEVENALQELKHD